VRAPKLTTARQSRRRMDLPGHRFRRHWRRRHPVREHRLQLRDLCSRRDRISTLVARSADSDLAGDSSQPGPRLDTSNHQVEGTGKIGRVHRGWPGCAPISGLRDESNTILNAALAIDPRTKGDAAKRWTPWLAAYSGARMGEITQLRGADIVERGGGTPSRSARKPVR
jgi:hypothetical protein